MNPSRFLRFVPAFTLAVATFGASSLARGDDGSPGPRVRVHISSSSPALLQRRAAEGGTWLDACEAPCDRELPLADEYRVVYGKAGETGDSFRFAGTPGADVLLTVHPRSDATKTGGDVLIGVGTVVGVASLAGIVYFGSIAAQTSSKGACGDGRVSADGRDGGGSPLCGLGGPIAAVAALFSGVVLLGAVGMVAGGVALRADSGPSTTQRRRLDPPTVAVREPTWTAPHAPSTGKPSFVLPMSFSF